MKSKNPILCIILKKGEKKHITVSIINAILLILNIICYIKKGKQETAHA